ncbi:hypothetical protein FPOAC1_007266 [Fusarium poae]|uniref:hypothetical protein n=1 Tax=Fusarium poae TaxID=36050 RepID=UPI001CE7E87D|nr:hypothetical protein FPOAC1_007266 [Fusarium poae]KAG8673947.1 hypothetical protein FPOAC1_007266 [Fusarium poae]
MFNLQAQNNRLALLTDEVIEEKNARFRGIVKVPIDDLVFAPDFLPCDYNVSPAKVSRLKRIFRTEGCNRSEPSNFMLGTINENVLLEALQLSQLTLNDLQDSERPRMLYLPRFQYIRCANGRSRAAAVLDTPRLGTWWTVELYADLSPKTFDIIAENYVNEGAFSHGYICERILHHRIKSPSEEKRWWARLTKSLSCILKSLLKHPTIAPPLFELIQNIPGMRDGFEIGTWHKIIGGKCDEGRYIFQMRNDFTHCFLGEALLYVDIDDVRAFQLRVPGVSQVDYRYLAGLIESGVAFKRLSNTAERSQLLRRMKDIKYLLPSIYTLQKDFKYLRLCTDTMKRLLCGKKKIPFTVQVLAYDAFSQKAPIGPNEVFFERLKRLYICIMRDLVELTGEWPLLEDGEESPEVCFRHPENWHRLAQEARRLGFESDEIRRLAAENPDDQVALKALHDARPSSLYEYNQLELQDILNRIVNEFNRARLRVMEEDQSTFTTIGAGEPIARRCGRQYSGAYNRDRWSFDLVGFSHPVSNSRDITSLFVRKSVFHAFWRLDEDQDGDEPMLQPTDLSSPSRRDDSFEPTEAPADPDTYDEPMMEMDSEGRQTRVRQSSRQRAQRRSLVTNRGRTKAKYPLRKQKMHRMKSRRAVQKLRRQLATQGLPIQQQLAIQPQTSTGQPLVVQDRVQLERRGTDTPRQLSEGSINVSSSAMDLIAPFGQDAEMQILRYDGAGWRARSCRRGSISRMIDDAKSQLGEIDFYHREGRAIAEHEISQYQVRSYDIKARAEL